MSSLVAFFCFVRNHVQKIFIFLEMMCRAVILKIRSSIQITILTMAIRFISMNTGILLGYNSTYSNNLHFEIEH
jgi:hypothetical protein